MKTTLVIALVAMGCGAQQQPATPECPAPPAFERTAEGEIVRLKIGMREHPLDTLREIGLNDDNAEQLAKTLYFDWKSRHPDPPHPVIGATPAKDPATPKPYLDENGVMVMFSEHKWFCFTLATPSGDASIGMCAANAAECVEMANLVNMVPSCAPVEAATCTVTKFNDRPGHGGKCFRTAVDCLAAGTLVLQQGEQIYASCTTFRYRGY